MQFSAMPVVRPRAMRFFLALAVLMLAVVAVGFGPSLYLRRALGTVDRFGPSLPPHLLAHGAVLTVWYVLFVVQALLVRTGRRDVHRRLGVTGRRRLGRRRRVQPDHDAAASREARSWRRPVASACRICRRQRLLDTGRLHAFRRRSRSFQAPTRDSQATHAARVGVPPWPRVRHRTSDRSHTAAPLAERTPPLYGFHSSQHRRIDLLRRATKKRIEPATLWGVSRSAWPLRRRG